MQRPAPAHAPIEAANPSASRSPTERWQAAEPSRWPTLSGTAPTRRTHLMRHSSGDPDEKVGSSRIVLILALLGTLNPK